MTRGLRAVALACALLGVASALWFGLDALDDGLFWDDVNSLQAIDDLRLHPLEWSRWRELLSNHPPTAYFHQLALFEVFGSGGFAPAAHTLQLVVLLALLALLVLEAWRRHGPLHAVLAAGFFATWPALAAGGRAITQDLTVGLFGFLALVLTGRERDRAAIAAYTVASVVKLTALSFLLPLLLLQYLRGAGMRTAAVTTAVGSLPLLWVIVSKVRGAPSRHFAVLAEEGVTGLLRFVVVNGARHVLELLVYDLRFTIVAAVGLALLVFRRPGVRVSDFDVAIGIALVATVGVATVLGGTDSLERYLLPAAAPLGWVTAQALLAATPRVGAGLAAATLAVSLYVIWQPDGLATALDRRLGDWKPGLGRSIDAEPVWARDYVHARERLADELEQRASSTIGAPWPVSVYLRRPAAGYVDRGLAVRDWIPGRSTVGLSRVIVDDTQTRSFDAGAAGLRVVARFDDRYPVVVAVPR